MSAERAQWLASRDLAERWQVSASVLSTWRAKEVGPPYMKVGRVVRYRLSGVEAYKAQNTVGLRGASGLVGLQQEGPGRLIRVPRSRGDVTHQ